MKSRYTLGKKPSKTLLSTFIFFALVLANSAHCAEESFDFSAFDVVETETPYRDRIIDSTTLVPLLDDEDDKGLDEGLPRSFHAEWIAQESKQSGQTTREAGFSVGGFWDTENWGSFSADALMFHGEQSGTSDEKDWRGSATVWQRGLAMPGGWSVNNGLGVLNTSLPNLLREQYRFFLPGAPMIGASTEWLQRNNAVQLQASIGRGGVYRGARLSGFESGDGAIASLGAQTAWSPQWTGAAAMMATDGRIVPNTSGLPQFQNNRTTALLFAIRWQDPEDIVTLNFQASESESFASHDAAKAVGLWVDARANRGLYTHRYGTFYLEPDLAWGAFPINNDVMGAYYRLEYQRARWSWNTSLDRVTSISGNGFDGFYGNAFLRYQASPLLSYGGGVSLRDADANQATTLQLFADTHTNFGQTRFQYDAAKNESNNDSWQVLIDHSLPLREGMRLSLSAGFGELAYDIAQSTQSSSLAAYGGLDITDNISIDGTLRLSRDFGADASNTLDANLALRWRLNTQWSLLGNLYEVQGSRRSPFVLDPLANSSTFQSTAHDRSLYLSLRYNFQAGKAQSVLGGTATSATGSVAGSIFLDANKDNIRNASELPAANITVMLDNRYVARTDEQGRFQFNSVSTGNHIITVITDNLPLPWFVDEKSIEQKIKVEVREETIINIGAIQQR